MGACHSQTWPGTGGSAGRSTSFAFDFTEHGDIAIPADGDYDIGGYTFTAANVAAASTFAVQAGVGLRIQAIDGVSRSWNGTASSINAPALWIPLQNLFPDVLRIRSTLDIWFWITDVSLPISSNSFAAGVWSAEGSGYSGTMVGTGYLRAPAAPVGPGPMLQQGGTRVIGPDNTTAQDATVMRVPTEGILLVNAGVYAGGWPAEDTLTSVARGCNGYGTDPSALLVIRRPDDRVRLTFAACTNVATLGSTPAATVKRLEIFVGPPLR